MPSADSERPGMVDQAVGDSEGANLDVGAQVDLPHLLTGPQGMAPHNQIPLLEKESYYMRLLFGLLQLFLIIVIVY